MSYEEECIEAFRKDMVRQKTEDIYIEHFVQAFKSGFQFGSLNGAADGVKKWAVDNINPKKKEITVQDVRDMQERHKTRKANEEELINGSKS